VVFYLEERMKTQATFFETSRGLLNVGAVRLIVKEAETVKFIFDDARGAFIALPRREGETVLLQMANEMLIAE
jgi:hypothetical protein